MAEAPLTALRLRLWPTGDDEHVYGLFDGARDPRVYDLVTASGIESRCLYLGDLDPALARVAPYLVRLSRDAPSTAALLREAWGDSWMVLLRATVSMTAVHGHFRRLLRVQDERGVRMLFRFYDPRVLRTFLPTCRPDEVAQVFGPVEFFVLESEQGHVLQLRNLRGTLQQSEVRAEKHLRWLGDYLRKGREEDGG